MSDHEPPRYALSETARSYALTQVGDSAEHEALRAHHAHAVCRFFDASPEDWLHMTDADWLARYEPELDNLRAALAWAHPRDPQTVISLVGAAAPLWHHLSLHSEARRWHDVSEPMLNDHTPKPLAARWWRAAQWTWAEVDPDRSRAAAERTNALYRELGDVHGLYAQLTGLAGMWHEPNAQATAALQEALSLERPEWPARERAWGQRARADVAKAEGRLEDSRVAREAELQLRTQAGDERGRIRALSHLVDLALERVDAEESVRLSREFVASLRSKRSPASLCAALWRLSKALQAKGDDSEAKAITTEATALESELQL